MSSGAVALHHQLSGSHGDAVLLGGSLGTTASMWEPQVAALSPRMRVIAFDHRGHGRSPVPPAPYEIADLGHDVLALMDRGGIERASYVGLSIGGMVGLWLAGNHPERIEKLVLIATSAYLGVSEPWTERAATVRAAGTTEVIVDAVLARWFTPHWPPEHPAIIAALRADFCACPVEGYAGCCEAISQLDLRAELTRITAPTLVISGAEDTAIPSEHQRLIADTIPAARLELIEDAAHVLSLQHPETVNSLIAQHLEVDL